MLHTHKEAVHMAKSLQSCLTLWDPLDHSLPGSSVHRNLQARTLQWVTMPYSRGPSRSRSRDLTHVSYSCLLPMSLTSSALAGGFSTTSIAWDAQRGRKKIYYMIGFSKESRTGVSSRSVMFWESKERRWPGLLLWLRVRTGKEFSCVGRSLHNLNLLLVLRGITQAFLSFPRCGAQDKKGSSEVSKLSALKHQKSVKLITYVLYCECAEEEDVVSQSNQGFWPRLPFR